MKRMPAALAAKMAAVMIAVRVFTTLTIDGHHFLNSGWLCVLIGTAVSIPLAAVADKYLIGKINSGKNILYRMVYVIYFVYTAYQCAAVMRLLINSVSYSNLQIVPPIGISVFLMLAGVYIVAKNGVGIGGASKMCAIGLCIMGTVVLLAGIGELHISWLTPVFGPGKRALIKGALIVFGQMAAGVLLVLLADDKGRYECVKSVAAGGIGACVMCAYWSAMTPVQFTKHMNRLTGIELFLSNGRTSLAVLLPISLIWFTELLIAMYGSLYGAAASLRSVAADVKSAAAAAASALAALVIATAGLAESDILRKVMEFSWILAVCVLVLIIRRRRYADEV